MLDVIGMISESKGRFNGPFEISGGNRISSGISNLDLTHCSLPFLGTKLVLKGGVI
jgi:hypothetical protein